ncbi:MAG: hypothetical protein DMG35_11875 [Acidobacteria bacterium]|nr:MAG: hypothetical protein DMG35_11875 [Acidobacteriota bacterium]
MKKRESGFSRLFLIIVGSIVLVIVTGYLWGFQTMVWWEYRHNFAKKLPILNLTPQDLPKVAASPAEGMTLSHAGFEFEVPWVDLDGQKSKYFKKIVIYVFQSGRVITVFGLNPTHDDLLAAVEKSFDDKNGTLPKLFGEETTRTDYVFLRTMLEQTPDKLKPWMNERQSYRVSFLLMIKGISSVGGETGLFHVEDKGWKGFQYDDPAKKPKKVTLELYDSEDQHIEIMFSAGKQEGAEILQSDVNRVLQTLVLAAANSNTAAKSDVTPRSKGQRKPRG